MWGRHSGSVLSRNPVPPVFTGACFAFKVTPAKAMVLRQQKVSDKKQDFIKRSWETAIFLNSMVIYNDLAKTEKGDLVPDIMKSVSKIILDLMCNDTFLKELEKGD